MKPLKIFLTLTLLTVLISCTGAGHKDNRITFDTIRVQETYHLLRDTANPACQLTQVFIFPETWPDTALLSVAQNFFVTAFYGAGYEGYTPQDASERYLNAYLDKYISLEPDFVEDKEIAEELSLEAWFSYYEYRRDTILYNRDGLLSFAVYMSSYTGGAHGYASTSFYSLCVETVERITEDNFFIQDHEKEIAALIVKELCVQYDVEEPAQLEELGFFDVKEIFPNGNFFLNDKGITYAFNAYEIAGYVLGTIEVYLSYTDIKHLLVPDFFEKVATKKKKEG
ncbi:MAG: DUF3298 and DUF4163 domain-containing protein [Tannerellaceae bacterium]|jgi:hypothetical protein|nr:DUF3298 and DUF4163 domain-containing protein [Tannerellaceae bacterium]